MDLTGAGEGDLVLFFAGGQSFRGAYNPPTGGEWTEVGTGVCNTGVNNGHVRWYGWWAWWSESLNLTKAAQTGIRLISAYAFSGVDPDTPFDVATVTQVLDASTDPMVLPEITPVTDGALVLYSIGTGRSDSSKAPAATWSAHNLDSITEEYWQAEAGLETAYHILVHGPMATAGASGTPTIAIGDGNFGEGAHRVDLAIALRPAEVAGGGGLKWDGVLATPGRVLQT